MSEPVLRALTIAARPDRLYLCGMHASSRFASASAAWLGSSRILAVTAAAAVLLFAGTLLLWAHYGTAVFYEMLLAGIAACF